MWLNLHLFFFAVLVSWQSLRLHVPMLRLRQMGVPFGDTLFLCLSRSSCSASVRFFLARPREGDLRLIREGDLRLVRSSVCGGGGCRGNVLAAAPWTAPKAVLSVMRSVSALHHSLSRNTSCAETLHVCPARCSKAMRHVTAT